MRLLLIRHGSAEMGVDDDTRRLNEFGQMEASRIASWIKNLGFQEPTIWHSEKVRTKETATIIRDTIGWTSPLQEVPGIGPSSPVEPVANRIEAEDQDLVIVGHMPFMSLMASEMVTGGSAETYWNFETCAALCLERSGVGQWVVCGFCNSGQL